MAYIDILSPDSYGRYNRKLAKLTGLPTAVYWSAILEISTKVVQKKKYNKDGFFKLDRKYVTDRTSIDLEEQLNCDAALHNLGVLDVDESDINQIRVHLDIMIAIITDDTIKPTGATKESIKTTKKQKAENKSALIIESLSNCIIAMEPDDELASAYIGWLNTVYSKGICKKDQIKVFRDEINEFTDSKEVKLELIRKATALSYKCADWVINKYKQDNRIDSPTRLPEQKISTSLNTFEKF